jgi:hypothetical protein
MKKTNAKPSDLARVVYQRIRSTTSCPPRQVLDNLFDELFYVSMKTEESDHIKVTVTLIDPEKPDGKKTFKKRNEDKWTTIPFQDKIPFNVKTVTKLSKAADPWSSSLAVYFDTSNELFIWGMIDQALHYQSFLNYESTSGPDQPGIFQVAITDTGCLSVIYDYELLADLRQNVLISKYIDVFKEGVVHEYLKDMCSNFNQELKKAVTKELPNVSSVWGYQMTSIAATTLSRILIRIQNYKHGGALLISSNKVGLSVKYPISYNRLGTSMVNYIAQNNAYWYHSDRIDKALEKDEETISVDDYLGETVSEQNENNIYSEQKGAIRFVSSLSCVDGLIVLDKKFAVVGFGAVIKSENLPETVWLSKTIKINSKTLTKVQPTHFGTRHQSMFAYCWAHNDALGFVVSQDGDIRAIKRIDDKLIMWENIKVQRFLKSHALKSASDRREALINKKT